jgi:hypothetical protein
MASDRFPKAKYQVQLKYDVLKLVESVNIPELQWALLEITQNVKFVVANSFCA